MPKAQDVGGVSFQGLPIMIGAGVCKEPELTRKWLRVAPVVSGSYTIEARKGNSGERLFYPDTLEEFLKLGYGLNLFGLKNDGITNAIAAFSEVQLEHPLIISVVGFSVADYLHCVEIASTSENVSAIELNLSCPNTEHGVIFSFDLEMLEELFSTLQRHTKKPLWLKLSPYSDPQQLTSVATLVNKYSANISAIVTCNTFPNSYAGERAISPDLGLAGLSGPALKPISLGQVRQFRQHLKPEIDLIGVGGITTGNDVVDFFDAGATGVQLTSLPFWLKEPELLWSHLLDSETGKKLIEYKEKTS